MLTQRGIEKDILWILGIFRWGSKGKVSTFHVLQRYSGRVQREKTLRKLEIVILCTLGRLENDISCIL